MFSPKVGFEMFFQVPPPLSLVNRPLFIFVYRLETYNVTKIQLPGTLPNFFNPMIRSVVSFMCDVRFLSKSLLFINSSIH